MQEIYKKKTHREHILERPNMYIGAINENDVMEYCYDDGAVVYDETSYIPGLVKIINEIIDNSVDIAIKTEFEECDKIEVTITDEYIEVSDNGPGIPVKKNSDGEYIPYLCWGYAMSGSNFDDDEHRKHIGMNGVGSYCTNVWSKKFTGISDDGKNRYEITFKDNANEYVDTVKKSKGASGVTVKFYPDLERFGIDKISDVYRNVIKFRLINLNVAYPNLKFVFNGEKIKVKSFEDYVKMFSDDYVIYTAPSGKYKICVYPTQNDECIDYSFVNGLTIKDGGTHINFIYSYIVNYIYDNLVKKYKNIKKSDIKNNICVIAFLNDFTNAKFNSQTKEKITNTSAELEDYFEDNWDKFFKAIYKCKAIIDPIVNIYNMKEEYEKKQEIKKLNKTKTVKYEKYIKASKNKKYLMIVEGESALGSLMPAFGIENCGYFMLKGKPLNAWKISQQKFISNKELSSLYSIIRNEVYDEIVFATDEDLDGIHIRSLLAGFIRKYLNEYTDSVGILETPIIAAFKNEKIQRWIYSLDEDLKLKSGESSFYFKGLGSWEKDDLQHVIEVDGIDKMIQKLDFTNCDDSLDEWLGNDSEPRKKYILENEFSIADL